MVKPALEQARAILAVGDVLDLGARVEERLAAQQRSIATLTAEMTAARETLAALQREIEAKRTALTEEVAATLTRAKTEAEGARGILEAEILRLQATAKDWQRKETHARAEFVQTDRDLSQQITRLKTEIAALTRTLAQIGERAAEAAR